MSADKISDEDVELVARKLAQVDGSGDPSIMFIRHRESYQRRARVVLAALAGRLLPAGAEEDPERADWVVVAEQPNMPGVFLPWGNFTTRKRAERGLEELRGDGHNGAIRTRQVWVGPWVNVEEGS